MSAIALVDERLAKLQELVQSSQHGVIPERLQRWRELTAEKLAAIGAGDAAERLRGLRSTIVMGRYGARQPPPGLELAGQCDRFLRGLRTDLEQEPEAVLREQPSGRADFALTREGVFFAGHQFDAFRLVDSIFVTAKAEIEIVDGYLGGALLALLTGKAPAVRVAILTGTPDAKTIQLAAAFNQQHGGLSVRSSKAFHDRFVVIDRQEYYHFGASLKDLGNRGFMFSRIEEPAMMKALRTELDRAWSAASVVI